jgi:hypothetical protein
MNLVVIRVPLDFNWPLGKRYEEEAPPLGIGYQVWDDDKPAPVSPVRATEDGMILWLMEQGYTRQKAKHFVTNGSKLPEN